MRSVFAAIAMAVALPGCIGELGLVAPVDGQGIDVFDQELIDESRNDRKVAIRVRFPTNKPGEVRLVLISHGLDHTSSGHTRLTHLGEQYAMHGYVAIHVGHEWTGKLVDIPPHLVDRPRDVSFVLDALAAGEVAFPASFVSNLDVNEVGHIGHSMGSFTSQALAGAAFVLAGGAIINPTAFLDSRVIATANLSPQGPGQFGTFDNGSEANTWFPIEIPAFYIIGEREKNGQGCGNSPGDFMAEDWRLQPYARSQPVGAATTKFQAIIPDACHDDLGNNGSAAIESYTAVNSRRFFDVFVRGETWKRPQIGHGAPIPGLLFESK